jgi:nucleoside-diphosphate-sugar epimerase
MKGLTVVFGNGTVGHHVTGALSARGGAVRIAQRTRPASLAQGCTFAACDILQRDAVDRAVAGASQVLLAVGFPYDARVWRNVWPKAMTNVVEAGAKAGARVVFIDNLYQLGPQRTPLREDMPLTAQGNKPAILAGVTRIWQAAKDRVRFAALRCPDFYGPGVKVSHLGESAFGALARGKPAMLLVPPDTPHDFAYVPDIGRAALALLDAPDDAFGQVWNMPCARTQTPRQILQTGAAAAGVPLKVRSVPFALLPLLSPFSRLINEVVDVGFTWDRPFIVDGSKFTNRFHFDVTPFDEGAAATIRSFQQPAARRDGE